MRGPSRKVMNMPFSVEWFVENQVIYSEMWGNMSLEDIRQHSIACIECMSQTTRFVHMIVDLKSMQTLPLNAIQLRRAGTVLDQPNMGWMVLIAEDRSYMYVVKLVMQMVTKTRTRVVSSLDEAIEFLREQDQTIDWSQAGDSAFS